MNNVEICTFLGQIMNASEMIENNHYVIVQRKSQMSLHQLPKRQDQAWWVLAVFLLLACAYQFFNSTF
jgi:hypothetical protein